MARSLFKAMFSNAEPIEKPLFIKDFDDQDDLIKVLENISDDTKDTNVARDIEMDLRFIKAGVAGEKNVRYELVNSFIPMLILHDLRIQDADYKAQMDFVIITRKFICILETKKLNGHITINSNGDFIRSVTNRAGKVVKKEGMYSPVSQNLRHVRILKNLLLREEIITNTPVLSLVVMANPKSIINDRYAKKVVKNQIIKYDQITQKIKAMMDKHSEVNLSNYIMRDIARYLSEQNVTEPNSYMMKYQKRINMEKDKKLNEKAILTHERNFDVIKDKLIKFRLSQSREEKIKAYYIFNNKQMDGLLKVMPQNIDELNQCEGFGPVKSKKYGQQILDILKDI